jgi:hypothetical protein
VLDFLWLCVLASFEKVCGHQPASETFGLVVPSVCVLVLVLTCALAGPRWPLRPP